jgi:transposase
MPAGTSKGRKRHIAVDTLGLLIKCQVITANAQDRDTLPALSMAVSQKSHWVEPVFFDGGYAGDETRPVGNKASRIRHGVVIRSDRQITGIIVLPKRWILERTSAGSTDFAASPTSLGSEVLFAGLVQTGRGFLPMRTIARDYQMAA